MDREKFEAVDPLIDDIAGIVDQLLTSEQARELKSKLSRLSEILGESCSVTLECKLDVFDSVRERSMTWLSSGLSSCNGAEPYRSFGDSSLQRYIVRGEMVVMPHDYCPACWGSWDFKLSNQRSSCPECGAKLGDDVKVLLDDDICPHCEKGTISMNHPKCDDCGFEVDPRFVSWG